MVSVDGLFRFQEILLMVYRSWQTDIQWSYASVPASVEPSSLTLGNISQCFLNHFQCIKVNIQPRVQFIGRNPQLSWSFHLTFMQCYPEHGLSWTLLLHITHHLTVLMHTVWFPETFSKHQWIWMSIIFFLHDGIQWYASGSYTLSC